MKNITRALTALGVLAALGAAPATRADTDHDGHHGRLYHVTVTNLTRGESFTPILSVVHRAHPDLLFTEGSAASTQLAALAEGGDTGPLSTLLSGNADVAATDTAPGLLGPGQSVTFDVQARGRFDRLSLAAMMVPTNDGFFSVQNLRLPWGHRSRVVTSPAYDAGTEPNDELCISIPGPTCGGQGPSPGAGGEGYVHIHGGIHGIGDLVPAQRDWRNPVARVVITAGH